MEKKTSTKDLFRKYLENQCSPEEVKELLGYFNDPQNEVALRCLIAETLENVDLENDADQWAQASADTFSAIKKQLNPGKGKLLPLFKRTWFRVASAAIFILGGFALYNLIAEKRQQDIVQADSSRQLTEPGRNRAVLTLSDGKTITLETASNGTLAQQGTTKISKPIDGQLSYKSLIEKPTEVLFNSIVIPRGGQYQVVLSDGSKVWLNAASSLRFPATFFGKERKVLLTGEAYFEVAKNASMPFKVEVDGKIEVEVLGTHFNVNAYNDERSVNTTILEGSVKVMGVATGNSHILAPGEEARLDGNGQINIYHDANTEHAMAWKNGAFNFNNADLGMVLRQLSRWYDVDIIFEGPVLEKKFNFSGEIQRNLKLSQVLKLLEQNNVFCRLEGKRLIVRQ